MTSRPQELRITTPLYTDTGDGFASHATGTLVAAGDKIFLVSANHAISEQGSLLLPGHPFTFLPCGRFICCDELDLAYCELTEENIRGLAVGSEIFPVDSGSIWTEQDGLPTGRARVFGFPVSLIHIDGDNHVAECAPLDQSAQICTLTQLKQMRLNTRTQFAINSKRLFDKNRKQVKKIDYHCLSGGAALVALPDGNLKLTGIIIEFYPRHNVLVAAQIWPLIKSIHKKLMSEPNTESEH